MTNKKEAVEKLPRQLRKIVLRMDEWARSEMKPGGILDGYNPNAPELYTIGLWIDEESGGVFAYNLRQDGFVINSQLPSYIIPEHIKDIFRDML